MPMSRPKPKIIIPTRTIVLEPRPQPKLPKENFYMEKWIEKHLPPVNTNFPGCKKRRNEMVKMCKIILELHEGDVDTLAAKLAWVTGLKKWTILYQYLPEFVDFGIIEIEINRWICKVPRITTSE